MNFNFVSSSRFIKKTLLFNSKSLQLFSSSNPKNNKYKDICEEEKEKIKARDAENRRKYFSPSTVFNRVFIIALPGSFIAYLFWYMKEIYNGTN